MSRRKIFLLSAVSIVVFSLFLSIRNKVWDGSERISLILNTSPLILLSLEPANSQAVLIAIPDNVVLSVPYGYSTYPASAVYKLGELDLKRGGGYLLAKSVENTFFVSINGFISTSDLPFNLKGEDFENFSLLKKKFFSIDREIALLIKQTTQKNKTNLTASEIFLIWNNIRNLKSDQITIIDLDALDFLEDDKQPDGTFYQKINLDKWDLKINNYFQDSKIREENIAIEIVNAAEVEDLASNFGKIFFNMGANIIGKNNAGESIDESCVIEYGKKEIARSFIASKLKRYYHCRLIQNKDSFESQADVKIILGKGFINQ